ncbi:putative serine esterase-domain-containing protein [Phycomyces nitens]|nr:putative serine esterase-domain-containing protein [Phycomyces nitens]
MTEKTIGLVVLQHGLWGNSAHMKYIYDKLKEAYGDSISILNAEVNEAKYTYDGVDICGERLISNIYSHIKQLAEKNLRVDRISFVGYSLGGLMIRYTIGILAKDGFFNNVIPQSFVTFATPHMGVRRPPNSVLGRTFNFLCEKMVSRSGKQLQLADDYENGRPILDVLADPDREFYKALEMFKVKRVYANVINDRTVPYWTAGLETIGYYSTPKSLQVTRHEKYPALLTAVDVKDPLKKEVSDSSWNPLLILLVFAPVVAPVFIVCAFFFIGGQGLISRHRVQGLLSGKTMITDNDIPQYKEDQEPHLARSDTILDEAFLDVIEGAHFQDQQGTETQEPVEKGSFQVHKDPYDVAFTTALQAIAEPLELTLVQQRIQKNLSRLEWERIFVFIQAMNAHASIVCREKRFIQKDGECVVQHFIDTFRP